MDIPDVLNSAKFISSHSTHVFVSEKGIEKAAKLILEDGLMKKPDDIQIDIFEPKDLNEKEVLEWLFLLDTLNFCFWSDTQEDLFTVHYLGKSWTGYRAMCAALSRAVKNGVPIYKPSYYSTITMSQLKGIFYSHNNTEIPQLSLRLHNLHEAANILNKKFRGEVLELLQQSNKSAQKLLKILVENFPSYCDISVYRGQKVSFLKRAQIFVADVWSRFGGTGYGEFKDIDTLTMFADYRVPQSLVYLEILHYTEALMETLKKGKHIERDSNEEIEIRGCSIWGVELIRQKLSEIFASNLENKSSTSVNSCMIDFFLWNYAKTHPHDMMSVPIHKTLTVFY